MAGTTFDKTNGSVTHRLRYAGASFSAVLVLNRIVGQCRATGVCTMAVRTFCAELMISETAFRNIRKWLEKNGYILVDSGINTTSRIGITQKTKDLYVMSGAYSDTELGVNYCLPRVNNTSPHGVNNSLPKQNNSRQDGGAPPLRAGRAPVKEGDCYYESE